MKLIKPKPGAVGRCRLYFMGVFNGLWIAYNWPPLLPYFIPAVGLVWMALEIAEGKPDHAPREALRRRRHVRSARRFDASARSAPGAPAPRSAQPAPRGWDVLV